MWARRLHRLVIFSNYPTRFDTVPIVIKLLRVWLSMETGMSINANGVTTQIVAKEKPW